MSSENEVSEIVVKNPYLVRAVQEFSKRMKLNPEEVVAQALNTMVEFHKQRNQSQTQESTDRYLTRKLLDTFIDRIDRGGEGLSLDDLLKFKLLSSMLEEKPGATQADESDRLMKYAVLMKMLGPQETNMQQQLQSELASLRREFNEVLKTLMEKRNFEEAVGEMAKMFGEKVEELRESVGEKVSELRSAIPRSKEEESLDEVLARTVKEKLAAKVGDLVEKGLFKEEEVYTTTSTGKPQINWNSVLDKIVKLTETFAKNYTAAKNPPPPPLKEPEIFNTPPPQPHLNPVSYTAVEATQTQQGEDVAGDVGAVSESEMGEEPAMEVSKADAGHESEHAKAAHRKKK